MRQLSPGERLPVTTELLLTISEPLRRPLALALVGLDRSGRAAPAFPPIDSLSRELRPAARFEPDGVRLDLTAMPGAVQRLALLAFFADGRGATGFSSLRRLALSGPDFAFTVELAGRSDAALLLAEFYRHGGGWRITANGGGFSGGLSAAALSFGLDPAWARRLEGERRTEPAPRPAAAEAAGGGSTAAGSGVVVEPRLVLTNAHVVADAERFAVAGGAGRQPAELVFVDQRNDLAVLAVSRPLPAVATFRSGIDLHLGEEVVALGFPLQGLLGSGPQASAGNISALSGIANDCGQFQFTAPIASGSSGGPILDRSGLLIGIVTASLNLERVRAGGANAENVNFGVKGALVRSFLDAFGAAAAAQAGRPELPRAAMIRAARGFLYRVECLG